MRTRPDNEARSTYEKRLRAIARELRAGNAVAGDDAALVGAALRHYDRQRAREQGRKRTRPGRYTRLDGGTEARPRAIPAFVAVDGEGLDRSDGQHDYTFMAAGDGAYAERWGRGGLSSPECFNFLIATQQRHPKSKVIAFGFGYDSNMVARDLADTQVERFAEGETCTLRRGGRVYQVRYHNRHMMTVKRGEMRRDSRQRIKFHARPADAVTVWDAFGFFQSSFLQALIDWNIGTPEQRERIQMMKAARGEFDRTPRPRIRAYCIEECELLEALMTALGDVLAAVNIIPSRWDGAGALASTTLKQHAVDTHIERPEPGSPRDVAELCAYFGGRIERFRAGVIAEPVYDYDLNSAYPAEIAGLPSLAGGTWHHVKRWQSVKPWALWRVEWSTDGPLAPFPFRRQGAIYWPRNGEGWYHAPEVLAAMECIPGRYTVSEGYVFEPADGARPFAWVEDAYRQRLTYKQAGDQRNKPLKLALNALYGKLAQGESYGTNIPRFRSYYYAGRVTAGTRARMLRAAAMADPDALIAVATDGLFVRERLPLPLSDRLGDWGEGVIEPGLVVLQAGVMVSPSRQFLRSRGMGRDELHYDAVLSAWRQRGFRAQFAVRERRFAGAGYAVTMNNLALWRRWHDITRSLTFNPAPRKVVAPDRYDRWADNEPVYPPYVAPEAVSAPYRPKARHAWRDDPEALNALMDNEDADIDNWRTLL